VIECVFARFYAGLEPIHEYCVCVRARKIFRKTESKREMRATAQSHDGTLQAPSAVDTQFRQKLEMMFKEVQCVQFE
jgi:hypothetical protein